MTGVVAFLLGLLFGVGLLFSGMTDPGRVIGFLDVAGRWDPSLAFVMGGAVVFAAPFFVLARRRSRPLFGAAFEAPEREGTDVRLLGGAAVFGVGWGLAGLCPGPALVVLGLDPGAAWPFVLSLAVGLALGRAVSGEGGGRRRRQDRQGQSSTAAA